MGGGEVKGGKRIGARAPWGPGLPSMLGGSGKGSNAFCMLS